MQSLDHNRRMLDCAVLIAVMSLGGCGGGTTAVTTTAFAEPAGSMARVATTAPVGAFDSTEVPVGPSTTLPIPVAAMPEAPVAPAAPDPIAAPALPDTSTPPTAPAPTAAPVTPAAPAVPITTVAPATPVAPVAPVVPTPTPAATVPTAPTAAAPLAPTINLSSMPAPTLLADRGAGNQALRFNAARVMAANVADPSQVANASDIGAFREPCNFSHMSFDDPIAFPGQPGRSHLHTFFGNTATSSSTTAASLANSGDSTCAGGTLNRSSYWVPTMIDTRTGTPVKPSSSIFYYKTGYNGIRASAIQPLPQGLRMIAGSASNSTPSGPFRYGCVGGADTGWYGQAIPTCTVGDDMLMEVAFPQCWDGVNLDSPDHISHMANPVNGSCPSTHPVPVPLISFEIHYTIKSTDMPSKWRLSSDNYPSSLPGGYSGHGDWFSGWDPAIMSTMIANCQQRSLDCHAYLLGDGRTLY